MKSCTWSFDRNTSFLLGYRSMLVLSSRIYKLWSWPTSNALHYTEFEAIFPLKSQWRNVRQSPIGLTPLTIHSDLVTRGNSIASVVTMALASCLKIHGRLVTPLKFLCNRINSLTSCLHSFTNWIIVPFENATPINLIIQPALRSFISTFLFWLHERYNVVSVR